VKNRISFKIISTIIIISLVITAISVFIQIESAHKSEIKSFKTEIINLKKERLQVLTELLWNVNYISVNLFLENLLNNDKFIYAKIIETQGNIIEKGSKKNKNIIVEEFTLNKTVKNNNYYLGKIIIIADLDPLYVDLKHQTINTIVTELIKILLIVITIIFFLKKLLTNKIEIMAQYAKQLSINTLNEPLTIYKNKINYNELDDVVNAFNTMRHNLFEEITKNKQKDILLLSHSKMAAMGEMIGNIAHQWRQPLSAITISASTLKMYQELGVLKHDQLMKSLNIISISGQYLSDTIDDFRNFYNPDKEKTDFQLKNTIDKTFTLIDNQFKNQNINIINDISDTDLFGCENELIQVMINIFNNAKDELIQKDKKRTRLIFINNIIENNLLTLQIKDNAGGIPGEVISQIFEPYFTTKEKAKGTGIGLYMCKEIIEKHFHGNISVSNDSYMYNNTLYTGAAFSITISLKKNGNTTSIRT
jgi:signal transduction histidine kinase